MFAFPKSSTGGVWILNGVAHYLKYERFHKIIFFLPSLCTGQSGLWRDAFTSKPESGDHQGNVVPDIDIEYPKSNPEEYVDDSNSLWIAITTVIAVVVLSMLYGMLHYMVRQKRRRRAVLIRTIQGK